MEDGMTVEQTGNAGQKSSQGCALAVWPWANDLPQRLHLFIHKMGVLMSFSDFPGGSAIKESACNEGELSSMPGLGRSLGRGNGNPFQYSCLRTPRTEKPGGHGPWGHEELDTTERLTLKSFRQDNNKKWLK